MGLEKDGSEMAKMEIGIAGMNMNVYHTEVSEVLKGQGIAGKLLEKMVDYARVNKLKIIALCPYVVLNSKNTPNNTLISGIRTGIANNSVLRMLSHPRSKMM